MQSLCSIHHLGVRIFTWTIERAFVDVLLETQNTYQVSVISISIDIRHQYWHWAKRNKQLFMGRHSSSKLCDWFCSKSISCQAFRYSPLYSSINAYGSNFLLCRLCNFPDQKLLYPSGRIQECSHVKKNWLFLDFRKLNPFWKFPYAPLF